MKSVPGDREAFHLFTLKHDHVEAAQEESRMEIERGATKGKKKM